ncbi:MAG: DNA internalization-related competence protein ComEC/Rec2 [Deltaproteobacteria bacterium]|nr:DNA internalization-related competence protein ComEC/Rec2 [Deltaproteobacteria bacterium]
MNPLVPIAGAWIAGLLVAAVVPAGSWQTVVALFSLTAAILITVYSWRRHQRPRRPVAMLWNLLALGAVLSAAIAVGPARKQHNPPPPGLARLQVFVDSCSYRSDDTARSVVRVLKGERIEDLHPFPKEIFLQLGPTALPEGATIELIAQVRPWVPFRNPSPHPVLPSSPYIQGSGWIPSGHAVKIIANSWSASAISRARAAVRRALIQTLPRHAAAIARALILGDANAVAAEDKQTVRAAGLAHVFAVSGLHVVILVGMVFALLQYLLVRISWLSRRFETRRIVCALAVPFALIFAPFAGGAPSAWRAAITASIGWALVAMGKRGHPAATAAAAAIVLGARHPHQAIHPSFLLSIVATAAILSAPRLDRAGLRQWLRSGMTVSLRTTIATSPIALWYFGSVPIVGVFANLLLVPIASLLLVPLAALHALVASICPLLGALTSWPFCTVADAFVTSCGLFARLSFFNPLPPPDIAQGVTVAIAAALLLAVSSTRSRVFVVIIATLLVIAFEIRLRVVERPINRLRVTYLDVGQGDSALVDLPDGRLMLIDGGGNPNGGPDPGQAVLLPLLRARRRACVDIAVLSHPHPDHFGGLFAVFDHVAVKELWDTGQARAESESGDTREPSCVKLLEKARAKRTRVLGPRELCAKARDLGGAKVEVIWPCPAYDPGYEANDNSFVLRIQYAGQTFLFTGDIETHAESELVRGQAHLKADVLKVPHHGSKKSNTYEFLKAVGPRLAVISAGAFNRYGHPASEVVERLGQLGARIIRLDRTGGTVVIADGGGLQVENGEGCEKLKYNYQRSQDTKY